MGVGFLQLPPAVFYELTYDELKVMAEGKRGNTDEVVRAIWEAARFSATIGLQPHMKKGKKIKTTDLAVFPWEKKTAVSGAPPTAEQRKLLMQAAAEEAAKLKRAKRIIDEPIR